MKKPAILAIATLAFGQIVATVLEKWDAVTHGFNGLPVPIPDIFGFPIQGATGVYYTALILLVVVLWIAANILRTPFGRALVAIRDRSRPNRCSKWPEGRSSTTSSTNCRATRRFKAFCFWPDTVPSRSSPAITASVGVTRKSRWFPSRRSLAPAVR